jgi:hypothetical protein
MNVPIASRISAPVARGTGRAAPAGSGFEVREQPASGSTAPASGARAAFAADALLALQGGADSIEERRRRTVKRGRGLLDALDQLKAGFLGGAAPGTAVQRLRALVAETQDGADEPGLQEIMGEIELRARVELAKLGEAV